MATSIKTIKSQLTDDTIYPITKANAVYLANSTAQTVDGHLTNLEALIGSGSISNVGSSITGIIGNNTLATTAQTLSGAINELKSNIDFTRAAYTPTFSCATGTQPVVNNISFQYNKFGRILEINGRFNISSIGSLSASNSLQISLPTGLSAYDMGVGSCGEIIFPSNPNIPGMLRSNSGTAMFVTGSGGTPPTMVTGYYAIFAILILNE